MNRQKTLTVPLRNESKVVRGEDHLLNKPPNSMISINFIKFSFRDWRVWECYERQISLVVSCDF